MNKNQIEFEIASFDEATDAIIETINEKFFKGEVKDDRIIEIESKISNLFDEEFADNTYCLIEYPYVDKVYRDSYYKYYASKHYGYKRDCIRVSLFSSEIDAMMFLSSENHEYLKNSYRGFFTIRPLKNAIFGRSHLDHRLFQSSAQICSFESKSMVLGVKFKTLGFPHTSQDRETITCAETTVWGLMEYFGSKYPDYTPSLPSKIISSLKPLFFERQLPSKGLSMDEISFALKDFGFGTKIYSHETQEEELFNIIHYYIESGIPIVLGLESEDKKEGHAIVAIGKNYSEEVNLAEVEKDVFQINEEDSFSYIDFAKIHKKIVIQDDNLVPYREVTLDKIGEHYGKENNAYTYEIDSIVVPLYSKVYLEASIAKKISLRLIRDTIYGYTKFGSDFIFRFFLTSSRSFKSHITDIDGFDVDLKYEILGIKMPKFIWCTEIYSQENFLKDLKIANGLMILDATEANKESTDALIFAGYPDRCINMIENKFVYLSTSFSCYTYYNNFKKK